MYAMLWGFLETRFAQEIKGTFAMFGELSYRYFWVASSPFGLLLLRSTTGDSLLFFASALLD
jgi:hypothetical protein